MHCVAQYGHVQTTLALMARGAKARPRPRPRERGERLTLEALAGQVGVRDRKGRHPLHLAAQHGHPGACVALVAHGAALDARDDAGRTPLLCAAATGL
jgi:ankyrin repeat protein